jgi:hypothetical protein
MKGATLITNDGLFLDYAESALRNLGFEVSFGGGYIQAFKERTQVMFHPPHDAKAWRAGIDPATANLNRINDMTYGFFVECPWETMFCEIIRAIAKRAGKPFFVVNEVSVYAPEEITPSLMAV